MFIFQVKKIVYSFLFYKRINLLGRQNVRVTSISDGEDTGTEELTTSGTEIDVVTVVVVNTSLGQHSVVFDLRLTERRTVTGDDDQLG